MSDRIAEIRELIEQADDLRGMSDGAIQVLVGDLRAALMASTARLSAVSDALDREKLAESLRRGPLVWNPIYHVWSTVTHDVLPVVDAVRRHVLGEDAEHV